MAPGGVDYAECWGLVIHGTRGGLVMGQRVDVSEERVKVEMLAVFEKRK